LALVRQIFIDWPRSQNFEEIMPPHYTIADLCYLMRRLRDPETGCPWDAKQDYKSILTHTLEEVYEVIDAVENADYPQLRDELGDLLFQVVFLTQLAEEQERFDFEQVVTALTTKLLRRHPHVFPEGSLASRRSAETEFNDGDIAATWEALKKKERANRGTDGLLADIPKAMPAMQRALKLQKRAATVGFDWQSPVDVLPVVSGELAELQEAMVSEDQSAIEEEFGDLLFSCMNLSRHLVIDPERALRGANKKFSNRVEGMQQRVVKGDLTNLDGPALQALWQAVKETENGSGDAT
jgi:ATP diphosphatase